MLISIKLILFYFLTFIQVQSITNKFISYIMKILDFPKFFDPRGSLTFLQNRDQIPFEIKRVFWIYDVPGGEYRGGHANKTLHELIIAISGSFDIVVKDSVSLHLCSAAFEEGDYIRNFEEFKKASHE